MSNLNVLSVLIALVFSTQAGAEERGLAELFAAEGVDGTIVIASLKAGTTFVHNDARAQRRYPAASTFKIPNTLIAIEEKAVAGADSVFRWDGQKYAVPEWNRDQTLESAFKISCVWCYQQLAERIGEETYRTVLRNIRYGELREPFSLTTFWLDGGLQISAEEQIDFLKQVYNRALPFSPNGYDTLRQIMLKEQTPAYSLWAKTGWAARTEPQVGWYVGYVETRQDVWFFATNLRIRTREDLPLRQQLTHNALVEKGVIQ